MKDWVLALLVLLPEILIFYRKVIFSAHYVIPWDFRYYHLPLTTFIVRQYTSTVAHALCVPRSRSGPGAYYTERTGHIVDTFNEDEGGDNDALESEQCAEGTNTVCDGMGKSRLEFGRVMSGLRNHPKHGV